MNCEFPLKRRLRDVFTADPAMVDVSGVTARCLCRCPTVYVYAIELWKML